jgi:hypothetical protein
MKTTDAEKMSKTNRVFRPIDYPGVFAYYRMETIGQIPFPYRLPQYVRKQQFGR